MSDVHTLRVYHDALAQLRSINGIGSAYGDLAHQIRRAALSVVSNLAEGSSRGSDREYVRFLCIARASNSEVGAQLDALTALGSPAAAALRERNAAVGRQLSGLIRYLRGSG